MRYFGSMKKNGSILEIGGIEVTELAKKYGTPLYIMDTKLIKSNMRAYKENFVSDKFRTQITYASKAFLSKYMCKLVESLDMDIDAVSAGELYTIKSSGIDMKRVHMHGNNKSFEELSMCLDYDIGSIIIDNFLEVKRLKKLCEEKKKKVDVMLRVNIGVDAHTHEYIKTSKHNSKFGESIFDEKLVELIKEISDDKNLNFLGFHCHIGSQIFDTSAFLESIEIVTEYTKFISQKLDIKVPEINLGGGFGVYYTEEDTEIDIASFMKNMIEKLEKTFRENEIDIQKVTIEPGRSIVANAGSTLYSVGGEKTTYGGVKYLFIDGGMTDNIRPALYGAKYEGIVANKLDEEVMQKVTVAGKCCESGDILIKDCEISKFEIGDLFLISSTGAYGYSMASNYNKLPRPAVVFVEDGKEVLSIKRESFEDMIKNDVNVEL